MNWLDIIMLLILIYIIMRGLKLGLVLSIFSMFQLIASIIITNIYYPLLYEFIIHSPRIYAVFEGITECILKILFHSKIKENRHFIIHLFETGLSNVIITIASIIIVFCISNLLISFILEFLSFVLEAPVLKQLNKMGGLIFGLIEGLLIIYILNVILSPMASVLPYSFIADGVNNSLIFNYIGSLDINYCIGNPYPF